MASAVYILCALTSFACAFLLFRGYRHNGFRLLLWTAIGFVSFALNNVLLYVDAIVYPNLDLMTIRTIPALFGTAVMIYGLITETV